MEVRNSQFAAFIDVFTPNTYVMVVISDHSLRKYIYTLKIVSSKLKADQNFNFFSI